MLLDPKRTVAELKELRSLTSDPEGAQRVAFSPAWVKARDWFARKLEALPVEVHRDEAGNLWATLPGDSPRAVIIGSHLDSVPNGGWLDGCLGVLAGLEILRRLAGQGRGKPPVTVRLVDWADEEGARFGRSLFGSSACSGSLDLEAARLLADREGIGLPEALARIGVEFERVKECGREFKGAGAYLELHIEQGPVLLDLGQPLGVVLGTYGVERHAIAFHGRAAHAGSTPMHRRQDALLAAAKMSPEIYRLAALHGGVGTIGSCETKPGIPTSVVAECRLVLDLRHLDRAALARMLQDARQAAARFAAEGGVTVSWTPLLRIDPMPFDANLIRLCGEAIGEEAGPAPRLPSGPLHDAAEAARAGVPTAMMFVQSLGGISHSRLEDTKEEDLEAAVAAFDRLVEKTLDWVARAQPR